MESLNRRTMLRATAGAGLLTASLENTSAKAASAAAPLKAVVNLGGKSYEYREETGQDLGDFVSPIGGFTQRCIRSAVAGSPLTVFFRPDRNSGRTEVVFELGKLFNAAPANLANYSVVISQGTQVLATVDVPQHYWYARWRWQSAARPVVGDVAALVAQGFLPPYDRSGVIPSAPAAVPANLLHLPSGEWINLEIFKEVAAGNYAHVSALVVPPGTAAGTTSLTSASSQTSGSNIPSSYAIMGLAGLFAYMPNTGERADIGPVTEPQAEYICTARQSALDLLRAQAEAAGSIPWHMRDENTGAPLDFRTYPNASWYDDRAGNPAIKAAASGTPITVDSAHQPALSYVPYLLTGDPYHLEDLQFQTNWNWGTLPPSYRPSIPQGRAFAWSIRSLAQAAKMTPETTPAWLLPRAYWLQQMETYRQFFEKNYVNSTSPPQFYFRTNTNVDDSRDEPLAPGGTWAATWEDEFIATILGWMVSMGFGEWRKSFDWKIGSTVARSGKTSGWVRAHSTPYRLILRAGKTAPYVTSWAAAWELTKTVTQLSFVDPNMWVSSDMTYLTYTRGALVYANKLGVGAAENLDWATGQLKAKKWNTAYKWRMGTGL